MSQRCQTKPREESMSMAWAEMHGSTGFINQSDDEAKPTFDFFYVIFG
mgnify:FL=1